MEYRLNPSGASLSEKAFYNFEYMMSNHFAIMISIFTTLGTSDVSRNSFSTAVELT